MTRILSGNCFVMGKQIFKVGIFFINNNFWNYRKMYFYIYFVLNKMGSESIENNLRNVLN